MEAAFLADIAETVKSLTPKSGIRVVIRAEEDFLNETDSVCVIGTSFPHLPASYILEAFGRLSQGRDCFVAGPTDEGGFYLAGASRGNSRALLKEITRSTANVFRETLQQAVMGDTAVSLLPSLQEMERLEHLRRLSRDLRRGVVIAPHTQYFLRKIGYE
ncbi:MAG: DUF2064 domain-containing protein [Armatimonadota bacterium]